MYFYQLIDSLDAASRTEPDSHWFHGAAHDCTDEVERIQKACLAAKMRFNIKLFSLNPGPAELLNAAEQKEIGELSNLAKNNQAAFTAVVNNVFNEVPIQRQALADGNYSQRIVDFIKGDTYKKYQNAHAHGLNKGRLAEALPQQAQLIFTVMDDVQSIVAKEPGIAGALQQSISDAKTTRKLHTYLGRVRNTYVLTDVLNATYQHVENDYQLADSIRLQIGGEDLTLETMLQRAAGTGKPWKAIFKTIAYFRFVNLSFRHDEGLTPAQRVAAKDQLNMIDAYERHLVAKSSEAFADLKGVDVYLDDISPFRFYDILDGVEQDLKRLQDSLQDGGGDVRMERDQDPYRLINELKNELMTIIRLYPMGDELQGEFHGDTLFDTLDDKLCNVSLLRLAALHRLLSNRMRSIDVKHATYQKIVDILATYGQEIVAMRSPQVRKVIEDSVEVNSVREILADAADNAEAKSSNKDAREVRTLISSVRLDPLRVESIQIPGADFVHELATVAPDLSRLCQKMIAIDHDGKGAAGIFRGQFKALESLAQWDGTFSKIWHDAHHTYMCERWNNRLLKRSNDYIHPGMFSWPKHVDAAKNFRTDLSSLRDADQVTKLDDRLLPQVARSISTRDVAHAYQRFAFSSGHLKALTDLENDAHSAWLKAEAPDKAAKKVEHTDAKQARINYYQGGYAQAYRAAVEQPLTHATRRQAMELRIMTEAMMVYTNAEAYDKGYAKIIDALLDRMPKECFVSQQTRLRLLICKVHRDLYRYENRQVGWSSPPEDKVDRLKFIVHGEHPEDGGAPHNGLMDMFHLIGKMELNIDGSVKKHHTIGDLTQRVTNFLLQQYRILYYYDRDNGGKRVENIILDALRDLKTFVSDEQCYYLNSQVAQVAEDYDNNVPLGNYDGPQLLGAEVDVDDLVPEI